MTRKSLLQTTVWGAIVALPIVMAGASANATPYAYASNSDTDFVIVAGTPGNYSILNGTFTSVNTTNTSGLNAPFTPSASNGPVTTATGADALQATNGSGPFPAENTFTEALNVPTGNGVRSDSTDSGFAGNGAEVAEGRLLNQPVGGSGTGSGAISSITLTAIINNPTSLTVSFNTSIGQQVTTSQLGDVADSIISSSVGIQNSGGQTVFTFAPDGTTNAAVGGTTNSDPFSLNKSISSFSGVGSSALLTNSGFFSATTNVLAVGTYTIIIGQSAKVDLTSGQQIPEPASLALLGAGLVGLGMARRGRKKA